MALANFAGDGGGGGAGAGGNGGNIVIITSSICKTLVEGTTYWETDVSGGSAGAVGESGKNGHVSGETYGNGNDGGTSTSGQSGKYMLVII